MSNKEEIPQQLQLQPALIATSNEDVKENPNNKDDKPSVTEEENKQKPDIKKDTNVLPTNTKGLHTVFIHKLYNMLEDEDLKHLIWWSPSTESFLITPGEDFSKVLAQYFKHTNVASFIRQLNMYGFHKVSDGGNVGTVGNDPIWEFKHNSGSFRKGDIDGLKTIKRRSSKHSQRGINNNNNQNDSNLSDTETSERSNSFSDLKSLNTPDSGGNVSTMDPVLNMRLAELGHNLAALRHEHARLQLRYDNATEDLRKTNLDMVFLIDLIQKLIHSSKSTNPKDNSSNLLGSPSSVDQTKTRKLNEEETSSPGSNPNVGRSNNDKFTLAEVESDIARFRASIIQRAGSKDFDQFPISFAPSYQISQQPNIHKSSVTSQPNPSLNQQKQQSPSQQPLSASQSPSDSTGPVPYPYPYPQSRHSSAHQIHLIQQGNKKPQQSQQIVHDPFANDRKASTSSSKQRNMSILYDPLQLAPQSPANTSIHRSSLSGQPTTLDSNLTSPMVSQGSYFPDYGTYNQQPGQHPIANPNLNKYQIPPYHQNAPHDQNRPTKDQRSGSYPGLIPNIHYSFRGTNEEFIRKRSESNEGAVRSIYDNLPRSIPRPGNEEHITQQPQPQPQHQQSFPPNPYHHHPHHQQHQHMAPTPVSSASLLNNLRRESVSPSSVLEHQKSQPFQHQQQIFQNETLTAENGNGAGPNVPSQSSNSGVYALLNPTKDVNNDSIATVLNAKNSNKRQKK